MTDLNELEAISPLDGRYKSKTKELSGYFSEFALIKNRLRAEAEYLIALSKEPSLDLRELNSEEQVLIRDLYTKTEKLKSLGTAVKEIEKVTNHDLKSVEYYFKESLNGTSLEDVKEWIHFALTSEDINNISYSLMLSEALDEVIIPYLEKLTGELDSLAVKYKDIAMLSRTHGQSASPTTVGKEIKVFSARLTRQLEELKRIEVLAKLNGATGNYNAHLIAYPDIDWQQFTSKFIAQLNEKLSVKLKVNPVSTQIESHDNIAELSDIMKRINNILIDFNQDMWRYISDDWFKQKIKSGEVGSSTMPHKVNPIDFENSEGNLGLANALFEFFSRKLPISRLQRDLSDSTTLRNIGSAFAYSLIAYKSCMKGLSKIEINETAIATALDQHPEVIAEAIQTIMRVEGLEVPYEKLKELTRGKKITLDNFIEFIDSLEIKPELKAKLKAIKPDNYTGLASEIAKLS